MLVVSNYKMPQQLFHVQNKIHTLLLDTFAYVSSSLIASVNILVVHILVI